MIKKEGGFKIKSPSLVESPSISPIRFWSWNI